MKRFSEEVRTYLEAYPETRAVEVLFTDINGIPRGKQYPVDVLNGIGAKGIAMPASTLLLDAQGAVVPSELGEGFYGDPDVLFLPVPGTLGPVPWSSGETAQLLTWAHDFDGTPYFCDPRIVLARAIEPLTAMGLKPVIALESEFYLLDPKGNTPSPVPPPGDLPRLKGPQCLSMERFYDFKGFIRDIETACRELDVPLTSVLCEYGDAQFEANLHHTDDALGACDDLTRLERVISAAARKAGAVASFMAKPITGGTGCGMHVHVSLVDRDGRNHFAGEGGDKRFRHAVGGVLAALPESIAVMCPNANSYRRYQPQAFVPQSASWGANHRSVAVRVPHADEANRRLEHRVPGADACHYLVVAAILAAIHHGLTNRIEPGPESVPGTPQVPGPPFPNRWPTALDAFAAGTILPAYLGEDFHATYLRTKRIEENRFNAEVSPKDHEWYFRVV